MAYNKDDMCYITSHAEHEKLRQKKSVIISNDPTSLKAISNDYIYTIELEIIDEDYKGPKQGFFIPRLFMHSFNIKTIKDKHYLCQSWFREFKYHCTEIDNLDEWISKLIYLLENFKTNPKDLFEFFGYKSFNKLKQMLRHLQKVKNIKYRIEIHD